MKYTSITTLDRIRNLSKNSLNKERKKYSTEIKLSKLENQYIFETEQNRIEYIQELQFIINYINLCLERKWKRK